MANKAISTDSPYRMMALLVPIEAAAHRLGVGVTTFRELSREEPSFPKPVRLGARLVRWRLDDLDSWVACLPTEKPAPSASKGCA